MKIAKTQHGFTLVELMVALVLLGGFLIVLTSMFAATMQLQAESQATSAVIQDGQFMMARLTYDIQRADAITVPAALGGSGTALTVTISAVSNSYAVTGGKLQVTNGSGTTDLNGNRTTISALTVQRLGNVGGKDTIKFSFTVTSTGRDNAGTKTQTYTSTVGRR
jgi:prepilin-type N-terminal cleavage/methylation domain-containing protein